MKHPSLTGQPRRHAPVLAGALVLVAGWVAGWAFAGCDDGDEISGDAGEPTILDILGSDPRFSMLVAAAARADRLDALTHDELTLLAPTNEAFAASGITLEQIDAMPVESLESVLAYHALPGATLSPDLAPGPVTTAGGLTILVAAEDGITLNGGHDVEGGADVVTADIVAENGVIHAIDRVLIPPDLARLAGYAGLSDLIAAASIAGLADELTGDDPLTLLAPTNDAFDALSSIPSGRALETTLRYHLIAGRVPSGDVPERAASLAENVYGDFLTLLFDDASGVVVNARAKVLLADLQATNGTLHVIDQVLVPMDAIEAARAAGLTGLLAAIDAAVLPDGRPLADLLSAQAPYTLFAPTNAAFEAVAPATLAPEQIADVLLFHVLDPMRYQSPMLAAELPAQPSELATANGAPATFDPTTTPPTIEGAAIVSTDLVVTNGVLHEIDAVIFPPPD